MNKYNDSNLDYFEPSKTEISKKEKKDIKKDISKFERDITDRRYKSSRATAKVIGYVKKQNN